MLVDSICISPPAPSHPLAHSACCGAHAASLRELLVALSCRVRPRDLYIYTFPLQLLLLLWILFGYSVMFDSALESGGFTSNKLSGFMVCAPSNQQGVCAWASLSSSSPVHGSELIAYCERK
jgi:hypothetical protein